MARSTAARSDSPRTGRGKTKVPFKGYVNWSMDRIDKKLYKEWSNGRNIFEDEVPTVIDSGYKLSLSYDEYNQACVASLYCQDKKSGNAGWCLTARAAEPYESLLRLLYLHFVCLEQAWPDETSPSGDGWQ